MRCPFCNHEESKVTDSRDAVEMNAIRRRRECCQCMKRFTTFETVDLSLQVKKRDGTFEDFQQEKLIHGMDAACRHTRVSHDQVRALAYKIKTELMAKGVREISSQELGDIVIRQLKETDLVAYIRFACVYKRFKDVRELLAAIEELSSDEGRESLTAKGQQGSCCNGADSSVHSPLKGRDCARAAVQELENEENSHHATTEK